MPQLDQFIRAVSLIAIVMACSAEPAYADAALIARGYALAMNCCSRCHVIGKNLERTTENPPNRRPSAIFRADIGWPT